MLRLNPEKLPLSRVDPPPQPGSVTRDICNYGYFPRLSRCVRTPYMHANTVRAFSCETAHPSHSLRERSHQTALQTPPKGMSQETGSPGTPTHGLYHFQLNMGRVEVAETCRNATTLVLRRVCVMEESELHGIGSHFQPQQSEMMRFGLSHQRFPDDTKTLQICSYFSLMNDKTSGVIEKRQKKLCEKASLASLLRAVSGWW